VGNGGGRPLSTDRESRERRKSGRRGVVSHVSPLIILGVLRGGTSDFRTPRASLGSSVRDSPSPLSPTLRRQNRPRYHTPRYSGPKRDFGRRTARIRKVRSRSMNNNEIDVVRRTIKIRRTASTTTVEKNRFQYRRVIDRRE